MIKNIIQEGFILKTKGYYKHAIEAFYKALELDNTSSELLLEIADIYRLMNEEERALSYIEQILEKQPTHIGALQLLKTIFINKNALEEAEQTAKNIYCIEPSLNNLTEIFELLNKQNKFSEIFNYKTEESSAQLLYEKAYAKLHLNDFSNAELLINESLKLNNDNKSLFLKGKILYTMNRKQECIDIVNSLKIDYTNAEILNFVGLVKQFECDFKEALKFFKNAIKISPSQDEYYYNCASTYFKMGDTQQAKKYYNLAITLKPDNQNYHFALANLYYSEKHYKRAIEELHYDFFEAKLLKSIILYDSGYLTLARKELEKLAKEQPENELIKEYRKKIEKELEI